MRRVAPGLGTAANPEAIPRTGVTLSDGACFARGSVRTFLVACDAGAAVSFFIVICVATRPADACHLPQSLRTGSQPKCSARVFRRARRGRILELSCTAVPSSRIYLAYRFIVSLISVVICDFRCAAPNGVQSSSIARDNPRRSEDEDDEEASLAAMETIQTIVSILRSCTENRPVFREMEPSRRADEKSGGLEAIFVARQSQQEGF